MKESFSRNAGRGWRVLSSVVVILACLLLSLTSASADPEPQPQVVDPWAVDMIGGTQTSLKQGSVPNPWGCYGISNDPHNSKHNPGHIVGIGATICTSSNTPSYIFVHSQMARERWFGLETVDSGSSSTPYNIGRVRYVNIFPQSGNCNGQTFTWHVDSYHEAKNPTSPLYTATSPTNIKRRTCTLTP